MDTAMHELFLKLAILLWMMLPACGGEPLPLPKTTITYADLPPGDHLLVTPLETPETLLGRAVNFRRDGSVEISDKVDPRCEVFPDTSRDKWSDMLHQGARYLAGAASELDRIARAHRARESARMVLSIANQTRITAELRGYCGQHVVTGVSVGTGDRALRYKKSDGRRSRLVTDEKSATAWQTPKAWAVTISTGISQPELVIHMPEKVRVWESFSPKISTGHRDLWLIVLSCDSDDMCWILKPSPEIPDIALEAHQSTSLPPLAAGLPAEERVVAYGFPDEADYRRYAPRGVDMTEEECTIYANRLYARLKDGELPKERWSRAIFRYEIVPTD